MWSFYRKFAVFFLVSFGSVFCNFQNENFMKKAFLKKTLLFFGFGIFLRPFLNLLETWRKFLTFLADGGLKKRTIPKRRNLT